MTALETKTSLEISCEPSAGGYHAMQSLIFPDISEIFIITRRNYYTCEWPELYVNRDGFCSIIRHVLKSINH